MTDKKYIKIDLFETIITALLVILMILTFIVNQHKSNWGSGPALIFFELIAIGLQILLNIIAVISKYKIIKVAMLVISLGLLGFISWSFIQFNLNCS
jgi:hypothetical protein